MDFFGTLGIALGLAMLAGINLYLTIFMTGLAVRLGWFGDSALTSALDGFGHPAVVAVALGLFVVQFIIDKIPWLDSLWDSIHTFLKPAGGVLLALTSLGPDAGTVSQVFVAIIALAGSLLTHGVKASLRLTINTSPEPFSNIGASVAEDLLVIGGFSLLSSHPTIALLVFAAALVLFIYLTPRVTRSIRAILWLIWKKLRVPAGGSEHASGGLPKKLSADAEALLQDELGGEKYHVDWCVPCVTGKTRNTGSVCRNLFGELIAIRERGGQLYFAGSRHFKKFLGVIDLGGALATHESRFLSEGVVVHDRHQKRHATFRFHRGQGEVAEHVADHLQDQIARIDEERSAGGMGVETGSEAGSGKSGLGEPAEEITTPARAAEGAAEELDAGSITDSEAKEASEEAVREADGGDSSFAAPKLAPLAPFPSMGAAAADGETTPSASGTETGGDPEVAGGPGGAADDDETKRGS